MKIKYESFKKIDDMKGALLIIIFLCLSSISFGQKKEYKEAIKKNTIEAFEGYIKNYPESKYIAKINKKLEVLEYQNAIEKNTIEVLNNFLNEYPSSNYCKKIESVLEPLIYNEAQDKNSIESYQRYLERFPKGRNLYSAKLKLKDLKYDAAIKENSKEAYEEFIEAYPSDNESKTINERLAELEYFEVKKDGTIEGYKKFIKKFPNNKYSKELSKIVNKDNPNVDFTPEKFFSYRFRNPASTEFNKWHDAYEANLYEKAKDKSYGFTEEYCLYLTLAPKSSHYAEAVNKVINKASYDFARKANFTIAKEYKLRKPEGQYIDDLTPEKIAENELDYLKSIYLSEKIEPAIARAKEYGVEEEDLQPFYKLQKEINAFEELNIKNFGQCSAFIEQHPLCPYNMVIREEVFTQKYSGISAANEKEIADLVYWVPRSQAPDFYTAAYEQINTLLNAHADSTGQADIIKPWVICPTYKFNTLEEKLFTADIFSKYAMLQLKENKMNNTAICFLTASAITHACFGDIQARYLKEALGFDFDDGSFANALERMQKNTEKAKVKLQQASNNIKTTRNLLYAVGLSSYFFGSTDFLDKVLAGVETEDENEEAILELAKKEAKKIKEQDNEVYKNSVAILSDLFKVDRDSWPSLRAFVVYPEVEPLENIVLMPRFYDYENNIEEYLNNFKPEAIALSKEWLKNSDETDKIERAYYILGYFKTPAGITPKQEIADDNKYLCYYNIRNDNNVSANKEKLISTAAAESKIALVLYNRVADEDVTPTGLKTWLIKNIDNKKYTDNETLHIFYKTINNLSSDEKAEVIDRMYNSYNMAWAEAASEFYKLEIPGKISDSYVKSVLEGATPYKKVDLIKHIAKNELSEYSNYVESYMEGNYYTEGDKTIVRRNLQNMFTKDIVVGYNQQINYTAVNAAVDKSEKIYKSLLLQLAMPGFDLLDYISSVNIIKKRFLTDDHLCVAGTEWILKNYDKEKVNNKPVFSDVKISSDEQKAVKTFLEAYFSDEPDFNQYTKQVQKLSDSDKWLNLVTINAQYGNKSEVSGSQTKIANPINDWGVGILNSNVKQRYLDIINW